MRNQMTLGAIAMSFAGWAALHASASAIINNVGLDANQNVTSVTLDGQVILVADLIRVSDVTEASCQSILVSDGGSVPVAGSRASVIDGDDSLTTGLANLSTIPNTTRLQFASPVTNGPGGDIILFEFGTTTGASDEYWRLTTKGGGSVDIDVEDAANGYITAGYNFDIYLGSPLPSTLAQLESGGTTFSLLNGGLDGYRVSAILIDLSDLGYAPGESITTLGVASGENQVSNGQPSNGARADLVAAYGVPVPEPATIGLLGLGGLLLLSSRR